MEDIIRYDTLIIVTPKDYDRLEKNYFRYAEWLPSRNIIFIGSDEVGEKLEKSALGERYRFAKEDDFIRFDEVYAYISEKLQPVLNGEALPRGICGWYYQQFLKFIYACKCEDEYYMVWDGDTIPCREFSMFGEDKRPYLDYKYEYHETYFKTLKRLLPEYPKAIKQSFIAEHMLFKCDFVKEMLKEIEENSSLSGDIFWKKIIDAIDINELASNSFSEFETYGTYVLHKHPEFYNLRCWNSLRYGGEYFNPDTICDRDFNWLGKDFFAISFEKGHSIREDHKNLFDNIKYQSKLSAKKMLLLAQEDFEEGYIEVWED